MDSNGNFVRLLQRNKFLLWLVIITITLLWGYAWVIMKASLAFMGPFTFSTFRFGIGALTLFFVLWLLKLGLPPKKYWKHFIVIGILQTSVMFLFVMFALKFVGAGKSSVLLYSMPIWSSLLAVKFLKEKLSLAKVIGLMMGLIGLLTILGWDIWKGQRVEVVFGEILIILAAIAWAVSNIYYRLHVQHLHPVQVSAFQMLFGTIGILIASLWMEDGQPIIWNVQSVYYLLFASIFASALCFTVWFMVMLVIDMATATISTLLVPIFGLLFSYVLLDEALTISILFGSSLIILGILISQAKTPKQSRKIRRGISSS